MERMEEKSELDSACVTARIKQVNTRRKQDEMVLVEKRGDLISKNLVTKRAAFLLVALRRQILMIPQGYARRFGRHHRQNASGSLMMATWQIRQCPTC
jgi:hypothetical protein